MLGLPTKGLTMKMFVEILSNLILLVTLLKILHKVLIVLLVNSCTNISSRTNASQSIIEAPLLSAAIKVLKQITEAFEDMLLYLFSTKLLEDPIKQEIFIFKFMYDEDSNQLQKAPFCTVTSQPTLRIAAGVSNTP
ncbi:hypothetical protein IEQ34_009410 [Dendrobium chrysotoxum]|uniref:HORMA domain-containing protein n=1 Tax=Dendrobium chrysotoxum TaxID=161865 RepID=A0AAV7GJ20_DENCH|nr:hypothetical protein IEQ34_009410 [Dendrobium chrysotoxum]